MTPKYTPLCHESSLGSGFSACPTKRMGACLPRTSSLYYQSDYEHYKRRWLAHKGGRHLTQGLLAWFFEMLDHTLGGRRTFGLCQGFDSAPWFVPSLFPTFIRLFHSVLVSFASLRIEFCLPSVVGFSYRANERIFLFRWSSPELASAS